MEHQNSIETELLSSSKEAAQVNDLNAQSWAAHFQNPKQALKLSQDALALSEQINYVKGKAYSRLNQGIAYWVLGEITEAKARLLQAVKEMSEMGDELGEAKAVNWLGNVYERLGNDIEALNCHLRAMELREKNSDTEGVGASLNNLGNLYLRLEDYPTALSYYFKALEIREQLKDEEGQAATLTNIGIIYYRLGKIAEARDYGLRGVERFRRCKNLQGYANVLNNLGLVYVKLGEDDKAIRFYNECREIYAELSDKQGEANALNNLGLLFVKKGKHSDALSYYEKSLEITRQVGDKLFEAETLLNIGKFYKQESQDEQATEKALDYLLKAREAAIELRSKKYLAEINKELSAIFEAKGDLKQAFAYFKIFQQAHAQVLEEKSEERLHALIARNDLQKAMQAAEIYRLKNIELAKANEMLAEANTALKEANQLKSELLAIAAHDLKNPLTAILDFIQGVLSTPEPQQQQRLLYLTIEFVERMLASIEMVLEMSEIDSGNIVLNRKKVDVGQLAMLVVAGYEHRAAKKRINIHEEIEESVTAFVDEDRLREILDNLISNAIKYSHPEKSVVVRVARLERGEKMNQPVVQIAICDEGQGFSEEEKSRLFQRFQRLSAKPTGGESSTGLGLAIVKQLIELHGGTIWAHSDGKDKGARFTIELPIKN
ncbi:MAG: tetratricopeptide repeat-containing sensor histidine kinase [Chloroherpetonaceae bacterium]